MAAIFKQLRGPCVYDGPLGACVVQWKHASEGFEPRQEAEAALPCLQLTFDPSENGPFARRGPPPSAKTVLVLIEWISGGERAALGLVRKRGTDYRPSPRQPG